MRWERTSHRRPLDAASAMAGSPPRIKSALIRPSPLAYGALATAASAATAILRNAMLMCEELRLAKPKGSSKDAFANWSRPSHFSL
eukprot:14786707-Alexandrium_andersonii.AAC.1